MNTHNLDSKRNILIQKQASKAGLRGKLNAYCISCVYDELAPGNWRKQVGNCTVADCPLYPVRPRSETQGPYTTVGEGC